MEAVMYTNITQRETEVRWSMHLVNLWFDNMQPTLSVLSMQPGPLGLNWNTTICCLPGPSSIAFQRSWMNILWGKQPGTLHIFSECLVHNHSIKIANRGVHKPKNLLLSRMTIWCNPSSDDDDVCIKIN
jgi:hypothetical protein